MGIVPLRDQYHDRVVINRRVLQNAYDLACTLGLAESTFSLRLSAIAGRQVSLAQIHRWLEVGPPVYVSRATQRLMCELAEELVQHNRVLINHNRSFLRTRGRRFISIGMVAATAAAATVAGIVVSDRVDYGLPLSAQAGYVHRGAPARSQTLEVGGGPGAEVPAPAQPVAAVELPARAQPPPQPESPNQERAGASAPAAVASDASSPMPTPAPSSPVSPARAIVTVSLGL